MIKTNKSYLTFMVAALAALLSTFNETFMNIALAGMCVQLAVPFSTIQWLVTAYMLGAAIMVPISAYLFRKIPTKILFLSVMSFFIVGSVMGALAGNNFTVVLIARIIQSVASGLVFPITINIALCIAPREKLGSYMGIMSAMACLGPSISVVVSGLILSVGDFHTLFWLFGAMCFVCFMLGVFFVGNVGKTSNVKLDFISFLLISFGLVGILFGLSYAFVTIIPAIIALSFGIVFMTLFVIRQNKISEPLIKLSPFKNKAYTLSLLLCMFGYGIVFAFDILLPQYLQTSMGLSPLNASFVLLPAILLSCIFAPFIGKFYDKYGIKWLLLVGFVLMAVFSAVLGIFINALDAIIIGAMFIPISFGSGLIIDSVQSCGLSSLKTEENPYGVTIFSTFFQITGCVCSSIFANIYSRIAYNAENLPTNSPKALLVISVILAVVSVIGFVISFVLNKLKTEEKLEKQKVSKVPVTSLVDIMRKDVFSINQNASIKELILYFTEKDITGCPITDDEGNFAGYISDGDIMRYLASQHSAFKFSYVFSALAGEKNEFETKLKDILFMKVCDIASKNIFYVNINDSLEDVCDVLAETHKKKVPVLSNNKMVGIVTRKDITKYILKYSLGL